jgi:hypothetical protein
MARGCGVEKWSSEKRLLFHARPGLPSAELHPKLYQLTKSPALVTASRAGFPVEPGSKRLSLSKGQTRRKAGTQSHGPSAGKHDAFVGRLVVAKLPKGWTGDEPVCPRAFPHPDSLRGTRVGRMPVATQGRVSGYKKACPCFFAGCGFIARQVPFLRFLSQPVQRIRRFVACIAHTAHFCRVAPLLVQRIRRFVASHGPFSRFLP